MEKNANKKSHKKPQNEQTTFWKEVLSWIEVVVIAAAIAFFINSFLIANSTIPTSSMEPTIMTDSRVIGSRLSYLTGDVERGDIVIFRFPLDEKTYFVKRVIGLPGDVIDIEDGRLYLNGSEEPLDEPYLAEPMSSEDEDKTRTHFEVPEDSYLCLGDNRNNSMDARYWDVVAKQHPDQYDPGKDYTYVSKKKIIAKVLFKYWPLPVKTVH